MFCLPPFRFYGNRSVHHPSKRLLASNSSPHLSQVPLLILDSPQILGIVRREGGETSGKNNSSNNGTTVNGGDSTSFYLQSLLIHLRQQDSGPVPALFQNVRLHLVIFHVMYFTNAFFFTFFLAIKKYNAN